MSSSSIRWWAAVILIEILPLLLANLVGTHPSRASTDAEQIWGHGWPLRLCWRDSKLSRWIGPSHHYYPDSPRPPDPVSSRFPFDKARALWRADPARIGFNVVACAGLLVTGGIACRRSRWVVSGKPQFSLAMFFVLLTVSSILAAMTANLTLVDVLVSLIPAPAIVAGILGTFEIVKRMRSLSVKASG